MGKRVTCVNKCNESISKTLPAQVKRSDKSEQASYPNMKRRNGYHIQLIPLFIHCEVPEAYL
jgi:hypothetical protein